MLLLEIDGTPTTIDAEQKYLLISNGIVYAGAEMSDKVSTTFRGRAVPGASDDPELVKLVTDFVLSVRNGTFQPS